MGSTGAPRRSPVVAAAVPRGFPRRRRLARPASSGPSKHVWHAAERPQAPTWSRKSLPRRRSAGYAQDKSEASPPETSLPCRAVILREGTFVLGPHRLRPNPATRVREPPSDTPGGPGSLASSRPVNVDTESSVRTETRPRAFTPIAQRPRAPHQASGPPIETLYPGQRNRSPSGRRHDRPALSPTHPASYTAGRRAG
jgi:hypothetical protein